MTDSRSQSRAAAQVHPDTPEQWVEELIAAGWKKESTTVWKSPQGFLYRGPFHAWQVMKLQQHAKRIR
jgi:hypothetical protein